MTNKSASVLLGYIKELAKEAGVPFTSYCTINVEFVVQADKIFEIHINGTGKIRPEKK